MLTDNTRVIPKSSDIAAKVIDGEAIIMNLSNGFYYSMDGVGAEIWQQVEDGETVGRIVGSLGHRYGIAQERAAEDVRVLVSRLLEEGLAVVSDEGDRQASGFAESPGGPGTGSYAPPNLQRYDDMADLLALDPPMPGLSDNGFEG
jgi:hypothetical protein